MNRDKLLILAAAVAGWWWWRRRQAGGASAGATMAPLNVNASTQIVQEDETGAALSELIQAISADPTLRTSFSFFGKGIDVAFTQSPPVSGVRRGIGGQPTLLIP